MLEPADLLLLDEPTNDLDIPTLEILEESLLEFEGALVLVTHDRYLLDRVSTVVLGLDGSGKAERFADYSQWAADQVMRVPAKLRATGPKAAVPATEPQRRKLSYLEGREYESIERRLSAMEEAIHEKRAALQEAAWKDPRALEQIHREIEASQQEIDLLYARWVELEEKVR
jgi:ATP-binding cassette subfamily F protein uup